MMCGEEKNLLSLLGIEQKLLSEPAHSLVITLFSHPSFWSVAPGKTSTMEAFTRSKIIKSSTESANNKGYINSG
jgi:hypothetical protein